MKGTVFNIQRFSIHDGPGIRTLVFMKGCPLRCLWCSNPEGLTAGLGLMSNPKLCIGCGLCEQSCQYGAILRQPDGSYEIDRSTCTRCLMCGKVCPTNSKKISGEVKTAEEIVSLVERDQVFYKHSGGGITIGGGEMLSQAEFSHAILKSCRERGIDTAIETSGYGSLEWLLKIADQCNTIHYDIKAFDSKLHRRLTGVDNALILRNIKALSEYLADKPDENRPELVLRLPLIAGYNTDPEDIRRTADFIAGDLPYYTVTEVLAFHNFGEQKYKDLGLHYEFFDCPNGTAADLEEPIGILTQAGLTLKLPKW